MEAGLSGGAKFIRTRMDTEYPQDKFNEVLSSLKGQQDNSFDSKVFHSLIQNIIKRERRPWTRALFHRGSRGEGPVSQSDVHFLVMSILEREGWEFDLPLYALKRDHGIPKRPHCGMKTVTLVTQCSIRGK